MGRAVDLLNQDAAFRGVAKEKLHNVLLPAGDICRLRRGVDDVAAVAGQLLHDVCTRLQAVHGKAAVGRGLKGADDRAARAACAGQILDREHGVFDRFARGAVVLEHAERGQRRVLKGECLASAGEDVKLLRRVFRERVAGGRCKLRDLVPSVAERVDGDLSVFVGRIVSEVIGLAREGLIAGVVHAECNGRDRGAGHAVDLVDRQRGLRMVFKYHGPQLVARQRDKLCRLLRREITGRRRNLGDLIGSGVKLLEEDFAAGVGLLRGQRRSVRPIDLEGCSGKDGPGVGVPFHDAQIRLFLVANNELRGLAGIKLHMVFGAVHDVAAGRVDLLH